MSNIKVNLDDDNDRRGVKTQIQGRERNEDRQNQTVPEIKNFER